MYSSKLHHTQIDKFHHIARLGVYALLMVSVVATSISLNSPGVSVGSGKARADNPSPTYTCKSFKIVTSNNGSGAEHATIGADYSGGKLIYYVDIESSTKKWGSLLNVQGLFGALQKGAVSNDGTKATFSLSFSSYSPPENMKGTKSEFSNSNMTLDGVSVGGTCVASLTVGAGPTPTPTTTQSAPTSTPTTISTPVEGYSAKYENGGVEYKFPGTNDAEAQVILKSGGKRMGDIKSGLLRLNVRDFSRDDICGQYIWYVQTTNTRSPDISADVTCPAAGSPDSGTTSVPKLESYSVGLEGDAVPANQHEVSRPKSSTKKIVVTAIVSGLTGNPKGYLNLYPLNVATVISGDQSREVESVADGSNRKFIWKFDPPADQSTDFQANFYPGTDKIHERVIIKVTDDPMTCVRKTCATGSKIYYEGTRSQSGGLKSTAYFDNATCTAPDITQQILDGSYCGRAFDPGTDGPVTIPNRLWLKYQITIGNGLVAGDKIVIAAKKYGSELKACSGRLGYSEFAVNNQFIECRQGQGTRTLIIKLVGQEEIRSWLAGSELLWGVRKATDTSNTNDPTADKSKGITVITGRGSTGIVGNIKYSGETEQYIEIPFTIDL